MLRKNKHDTQQKIRILIYIYINYADVTHYPFDLSPLSVPFNLCLVENICDRKHTIHKYRIRVYGYIYIYVYLYLCILQPQFIRPHEKPMVHFRLINVIVFCHVYSAKCCIY
jgi:hypothetical protein